MSRKSKNPRSTHIVSKTEGKSYKSALRINSTQVGSKCPKIPLPRSESTISVNKSVNNVHVKQKLIDRDFGPIFKLTKGVVSSNEKNAKQSSDSSPKNCCLNTGPDLAETLNRV